LKSTIDLQLSTRPLEKDDFASWANREAVPMLGRLRKFANQREQIQVVLATNSTGVFTTIWAETMSDNVSWAVDAHIIARATSGGAARARYEIAGLFFREAGGAATQFGATVTVLAIESAAGFDVQFTLGGNDLVLQVQDDAAHTVDWSAVVVVSETR
jgi:hypothetical protein